MMFNIKIISLLLLLSLSGSSFAQEVLSLDEILKQISQNNPALKAYENRIKGQDARVEGAGAWMAPMVGAGTFMTPYSGQNSETGERRGSFMITAEQGIPNPAKVRAKADYLAAQSAITGSEQNFLANQLKARATELYFNLLVDNKKIDYQKENLSIMQTMKKLGEIRFEFNQGGLNQIFKAEGRFYEAENMILMTESNIRSDKIELNALMYLPASNNFSIDTNYTVAFNPIVDLDTGYLAANRSDILQMDRSIDAMGLNIAQTRQEARPDFKIRFDHMFTYSALMPNQYTLMGMLSIPIAPWSSRGYKAEIKSMSFEREAMRQQKEAMLVESLGMVRAIENNLRNMQTQIANYENKILPALDKNLKVSMLSYQENKADLNTVIDGWEALNAAQLTYLDQLEKFYKMIVDYEKNIER